MPRHPVRWLAGTLVLVALSGVARPAPAGLCDDPIAGVWRGGHHTSGYEDWHVFRLALWRVAGSPTAVEGTITVEIWSGSRDRAVRPRCTPGSRAHHVVVEMRARGEADDRGLRLDGFDWRPLARRCGAIGAYAEDHFRGRLVGDRLHLHNDDGERVLARPIVFVREPCRPASTSRAPAPAAANARAT